MNGFENEKTIIEKIIKRDEKALFEVYTTYKQSIFNFIYRQIRDYHSAEEITQDVFFDFIESLRNFRGESKIKTFLFSIAKNKIIDHIRKKKLKKILFSALSPFVVESIATVVMDDELEKKEVSRKIKQVLDNLPNDYRVILRLKYIQGEKIKEIAQKLSMNFKAAESLLFRARKAFVKVFQKTS